MVSEVDAQSSAPQSPIRPEAASSAPDAKGSGYQVAAICLLLALAVGLVFGQTARFEFVNMDDPFNVYQNPHVTGGLSAEAVKWAFTERFAASWMPITWMSHMLAWQAFGQSAGGHHLTNVLLHAANAVLLFLVLRAMTGRLWPSALVAALFAIHPLRAESVAWVTERKDVLSGLFFMLTLAAYLGYARRPFSLLRYLAVIVLFALGLLSKPMLVTLPCVLLLLDYWPLGRWSGEAGKPRLRVAARLVLEKLPLFALVPVSAVMTVWAFGDVFDTLQQSCTLGWRIENALIAYVTYLGMFFDPAGLALYYSPPEPVFPLWKALGAVGLLVALTGIAWAVRRKRPYLLVGWLWCAGMLVPVSGVLQYAPVTLGDRFTYLPQIGLSIALAWALADVLRARPALRPVAGVAVVLLLAVLAGCAWRQTSFWRDSITLWNRTLACTERNWPAHDYLGSALLDAGRTDEAIEQYEAAIAIDPSAVNPRYNLGVAFVSVGRIYEAIGQYRAAIDIEPKSARCHYNLGVALAALGRMDDAIEEYEKTVELQPDNAVAHNNLGNALLVQGKLDAAMDHCRKALSMDPEIAEAHYNVGNILLYRGQADEAIPEYEAAIQTQPDLDGAHYCLGLALAKCGRFDEAIAEYRKALKAQPAYAAHVHNALGAALVARGRLEEAVVQYRKALAIQPDLVEAQINLGKVLAGSFQPAEQ